MRLKFWLLLAAAAIAAAAIFYGVDIYRHRFVRHNSELVRLIPPGDRSLLYVDLELLRKAQLLGILANVQVAPGQQYADFIHETGFDYTRDLEAVAIGIDPLKTFMIGRGRFHWEKLKSFALSHQGVCESDACRVPATQPGRWVNFVLIQPDVLAVAVSSLPDEGDELRPPGRRQQQEIPNAPVWVSPSHGLLANPAFLPLPVQLFLISLQSAESVFVTAEPHSVHLKAHFANAAAADTARSQLDIQTRTLTKAVTRNHEAIDPATLAGLLTAGSFQVIGTDTLGRWPINPALLKALQ